MTLTILPATVPCYYQFWKMLQILNLLKNQLKNVLHIQQFPQSNKNVFFLFDTVRI
jgi:hypothetical protein